MTELLSALWTGETVAATTSTEAAATTTAAAATTEVTESFWSFFVSQGMVASYIIALIAVVLYVLLKKLDTKYTNKVSAMDNRDEGDEKRDGIVRTVFSVLRALVVVLAALSILQANDVDVTAFIASLGVGAVIAGLALQDLLKDLIMGLHIMTDNFFNIGDVLEIAGRDYEVMKFNLRNTVLRDIDSNNIVSMCNRSIESIEVVNDSFYMNIPLAYEADYTVVDQAMEEICRTINEDEEITECTYMGTNKFDSSAIDYLIGYHCPPIKQRACKRRINRIIQKVLAKYGLSIPYDQLDIHTIS